MASGCLSAYLPPTNHTSNESSSGAPAGNFTWPSIQRAPSSAKFSLCVALSVFTPPGAAAAVAVRAFTSGVSASSASAGAGAALGFFAGASSTVLASAGWVELASELTSFQSKTRPPSTSTETTIKSRREFFMGWGGERGSGGEPPRFYEMRSVKLRSGWPLSETDLVALRPSASVALTLYLPGVSGPTCCVFQSSAPSLKSFIISLIEYMPETSRPCSSVTLSAAATGLPSESSTVIKSSVPFCRTSLPSAFWPSLSLTFAPSTLVELPLRALNEYSPAERPP